NRPLTLALSPQEERGRSFIRFEWCLYTVFARISLIGNRNFGPGYINGPRCAAALPLLLWRRGQGRGGPFFPISTLRIFCAAPIGNRRYGRAKLCVTSLGFAHALIVRLQIHRGSSGHWPAL